MLTADGTKHTDSTHLLLVEAEDALGAFLQRSFAAIHHSSETCKTGEQALDQMHHTRFDLVVLGLDLPDIDGLELLQRIRKRDLALPVIVLTTRSEIGDRVKALDLGADDYVVKPFSFAELAARCRAVLRRIRQSSPDPVLRVGDLELNRIERRAKRAGRLVSLTSKESALLECLMQNAGQCLSRALLTERVWKAPAESIMTNVVDVYINYLRAKIDRGQGPKLIHTIRGLGYQLKLADEDSPA